MLTKPIVKILSQHRQVKASCYTPPTLTVMYVNDFSVNPERKVKSCRMFVRNAKGMTASHLCSEPWPWQDSVQSGRLSTPTVALSIWRDSRCSWSGFISLWTDAMFPPGRYAGCHIPPHPMNRGIVLLTGKSADFLLRADAVPSSPRVPQPSLLKGFFLPTCEMSFFLPGSIFVASQPLLGCLLCDFPLPTPGLDKGWL